MLVIERAIKTEFLGYIELWELGVRRKFSFFWFRYNGSDYKIFYK